MAAKREEEDWVLEQVIEEWREKSFAQLAESVRARELEAYQRVAPSGKLYNVEVQVFWDHKPDGPVRVLVLVDDGSLRGAFKPRSSDFLLSPDGTFIGE
jgi:hypothetical protein